MIGFRNMIRVNLKELAGEHTPEYIAAQQLKERFNEEFSGFPNINGYIHIQTSVHLYAQKRKDIDILIMGVMDGFPCRNVRTLNMGAVRELKVKSFIVNIELKSHDIRGVRRDGTDYIVSYQNGDENASRQCSEAAFSLKNYLDGQDVVKLRCPAFIVGILWLNGLNRDELNVLRNNEKDNALPSVFSFKDFVDAMLLSANVINSSDGFVLDFLPGGKSGYDSIKRLFSSVRRLSAGLTRKKFEILSRNSNAEIDKLINNIGKRLTIVRGRAGTGKTLQLLQLAFKLADNLSCRCLLLTYNNALVSDIQRLIDYTPMPSNVDGKTVAIKTIHSFFHSLLVSTGIASTSSLNPNSRNYEERYDSLLCELLNYVGKTCTDADIQTLKDISEQRIDWDYIFIDEAQDFTNLEKSILFRIYGPRRIIVADGVDQFMRNNTPQNWREDIAENLVYSPPEMRVERRQKANLVHFVNTFANQSGIAWSVTANPELAGGNVIITSGLTKKIYEELEENCRNNGCEKYDILILVTPDDVSSDENGETHFSKAEGFNKSGISFYDGTNKANRYQYPVIDQCRVFQYDSCRGLEGWCVVCTNFDKLIEYKMRAYNAKADSLGLDSKIIMKRQVLLWTLMPLTRPIDTLVITLKDPSSEIGKLLKSISDLCNDFVRWKFDI